MIAEMPRKSQELQIKLRDLVIVMRVMRKMMTRIKTNLPNIPAGVSYVDGDSWPIDGPDVRIRPLSGMPIIATYSELLDFLPSQEPWIRGNELTLSDLAKHIKNHKEIAGDSRIFALDVMGGAYLFDPGDAYQHLLFSTGFRVKDVDRSGGPRTGRSAYVSMSYQPEVDRIAGMMSVDSNRAVVEGDAFNGRDWVRVDRRSDGHGYDIITWVPVGGMSYLDDVINESMRLALNGRELIEGSEKNYFDNLRIKIISLLIGRICKRVNEDGFLFIKLPIDYLSLPTNHLKTIAAAMKSALPPGHQIFIEPSTAHFMAMPEWERSGISKCGRKVLSTEELI